jgi:predicted unusual protein kinase regulating ubiquinone biosynthesis (AarF/ABC1/UbiB family)
MTQGKKDSSPKSSPPKKIQKIKSSVFSRSFSMAKMTLNAGTSMAANSLKNSFTKTDKEQNWMNFLKNQAEFISSELGELKGSLMKAGQMLSMYGEHFLPPEANEFLKNLQADSPALEWKAISPVLRKNLSKELLAELEIEHEALACASLGQVHRARIKATGEEIVLKIQYPNVDTAIESDLKGLKTILSMMRLIPKDLNLDPVFSEIHEMLTQETDYTLEARLTEEFYDKLKDDPRFIVPKVYRRFSNHRVLATSYEVGHRADSSEVQELTDDRREKIAMSFLDLYFKEIFLWKAVQTDPHIGNYRIRFNENGQDQIVLFDFGATREYDDDFVRSYRQMLKGLVLNDQKMFRRAATHLKFIDPSDDPELVRLFDEFCIESVEPFLTPEDPRIAPGTFDKDGNYDWKNTDLPQRLSKKVFKIIRQFKWRTPPREIIFLDRKTGGVFIFMSVLRARCQGRPLLLKYLEHSVD